MVAKVGRNTPSLRVVENTTFSAHDVAFIRLSEP